MSPAKEKEVRYELELSVTIVSDDGQGTRRESRWASTIPVDAGALAHPTMLGRQIATEMKKLRRKAE